MKGYLGSIPSSINSHEETLYCLHVDRPLLVGLKYGSSPPVGGCHDSHFLLC